MAPWLQRVGGWLNMFVALVCVAGVSLIWLATFQRISSEYEQAVDAAMSSNSNLVIAFEQQVYRTLRAAEQVASFVREHYLSQGPAIDLPQWVREEVIREEMFTIISIVDKHGDIVKSTLPAARVNYLDREFFTAQRDAAADQLYVSAPVIGRVSGLTRIPMSLRITGSEGQFEGVVVMSVDPDSFTDFYSRADLGSDGMLEVAGLDGIVRARKIGQESGYGYQARDLTWFRWQSSAPEGSFIDDGKLVDGVARIVSYRTLTDYPLMVTLATSYADDLAPVFQRRTNYLMAASIATVALLGFTSLLMLAIARQRSAAEALLASEALYRATFHQAAAGIAHIGPDGRVLRANDKFVKMLGYVTEEIVGRNFIKLTLPSHRSAAERFLANALSANPSASSSELEKPYRRKDGSALWVCEALGLVKDAHGEPTYLVAVTQDITARKELEARLSHDALHDSLTGLPNRAMFTDRLTRALESAHRHGWHTAVLYLDLDGFKEVNDTHGHAVGDLLLQQVAQRLSHSVRAEDTVARFGGDEFAIVLQAISEPSDSEMVATKVEKALAAVYDVGGFTVRVSASVGAAVFPIHGWDAKTLVLHADTAMYETKRNRKNRRHSDGNDGAAPRAIDRPHPACST